ncbi:PTS sugar transporter subunit IIA [Psychromonas sp. CD1]|uniref:PTS sugar transporter subunit IIA n=1 Tax=Psychromonas sp. CD1 TaxID=1979839 RepID=UPI000B9B0566|nr:PTS sugar transporter subunit IIA [Psychromonas sp. CD1]
MQKHIFFSIQKPALEMREISALKRSAGFFNSLIQIHNISRGGFANCKYALKVMSLNWRVGDLCQIKIEGLDAELSCMVFTDLINDYFQMLYTNHKRVAHEVTLSYQHSLESPFPFYFHQQKVDPETQYKKNKILLSLARMITSTHYKPLLSALLEREKISATGISSKIAMPHIISDLVDKPWIIVLPSDKNIYWSSHFSNIHLIIAIILPRNASTQVFKSIIKLSCMLLNPAFSQLLLQSNDPLEIETLLIYCFKY